ncbi:hypothetical protein [Sphingobacterium suaedae]|uniref:Uncharacterized protein n=1 Tax=Sphingobacterium suaedae TaxID=1686402 RepID=A0ABW5KIX6_9SPHI
MEIIKIEKQPTVADHIRAMEGGDTLRFDISHMKVVQEHTSRTMKKEKPGLKFSTEVNYGKRFIEVHAELKREGVSHAI